MSTVRVFNLHIPRDLVTLSYLAPVTCGSKSSLLGYLSLSYKTGITRLGRKSYYVIYLVTMFLDPARKVAESLSKENLG